MRKYHLFDPWLLSLDWGSVVSATMRQCWYRKKAPKFDPNEEKIIHLRATGGEVGASSALAPKIGPLGLSPKKVGEDIAKATGDWKGLRVTVRLTIKNRQAAVSVVPSASSLVIKALKEPPRDRKKEKNIKHTKSIPLDEIIEIGRTMRHKSMAKSLQGTVLEIVGTAFSTGCQIDGRSPKSVSDDIKSGEIESELSLAWPLVRNPKLTPFQSLRSKYYAPNEIQCNNCFKGTKAWETIHDTRISGVRRSYSRRSATSLPLSYSCSRNKPVSF
jgi:large subunit ribosomal protein L12e